MKARFYNALAAVLEWIAAKLEAYAAKPVRRVLRLRRHLTEEERHAVFARDGWCCLRCGTVADLQVDHVVPFSLGGECVFENFQTLCGECNRWKGVRTLDFRASR